MTLPSEEKWSLEHTRNFLRDLLDPKKTPRVPLKIRKEAGRCLKHYPFQFHIDDMYEKRIKDEI